MEPTAPFSLLNSFWQTQLQIIEESDLDFKNFSLPLARIKKVMKVDEDVKPMVHNKHKQTITILSVLDDFSRGFFYDHHFLFTLTLLGPNCIRKSV